MDVKLKSSGEKGNWFIVIDGKVAMEFKPDMAWKEMMEVTKVVEEDLIKLHIKNPLSSSQIFII